MTARAVLRRAATGAFGTALAIAVLPGAAGASVPLSVTTSALPNAAVDQSYTAALDAAGGTAPYTWSVTAGQLPSGLTLASNGDITGVPATAGTSSFTVKVTDSSTPTPETATKVLSIAVNKGVISVCDAAHVAAAVAAGGSYTFTCSGTILVTKPFTLTGQTVTLDGTGQSVTISGGGVSQIFVAKDGSRLTLDHLTLTGGAATASTVVQEGQPGTAGTNGNEGFPVLPYCCADGGNGGPGTGGTAGGKGQQGGDAKGGALEVDQGAFATVTGVTFSNDTATGGTGANGGDGGAGGTGGNGGYGSSWCELGAKTPAETAWSAGGGGKGGTGGDGGDGATGGAAHGGAISNAGTMSVSGSTFTNDGATGGGGGSGGAGGHGGSGGTGGTGGFGSIANGGANAAGGEAGDPGSAGTGGDGGAASGGAIYNTGSLQIDGSTFANSAAIGGDGGVGGAGAGGGSGGWGGGTHSQLHGTLLFPSGGSIGFIVVNLYSGYQDLHKTCTGNVAIGEPTVTFTGGAGGAGGNGSDGADGGDGGKGGNGDGAAIFSSGAITATGLMFTGGQATGGRGGQGGGGGLAGPSGFGGDGGYIATYRGPTGSFSLTAAGTGGLCANAKVTNPSPYSGSWQCPDTPTPGSGGVGGSPGGTQSGQPGTAGGAPVTGEAGTAGTTLHGCFGDTSATCVGGQGGSAGKTGAAGNGGTGGTAGGGGASNLSGCPLANGAASCGATVPPPPTGVLPIVTLGTTGKPQVDLAWTPPAADGGSAITGYDVYRSTVAGTQGSEVAQGVKTPSYADTSVSAGTAYYYEVEAVNAVGAGAASTQASILVTSSAEVQGISGTVTDAVTGAPLQGVCAYLYTVAGARTADPGVCTDSSGGYVMPVAHAGGYTVAFLDPTGSHVTWYGGATTQSAAEVVTVLPGATTPNVDAALSQVQGISGTVTDAITGTPLAGICVYPYTTTGQRTSDPSVCTGSSGQYLLPLAAAGTYDVAFIDPTSVNVTTWYGGTTTQFAATPVTVAAGRTVAGVNVVMAEIQGIAGTVTDAATGAPLAGICVYPYTTTGQRTSDPAVCTGTSGTYLLPVSTPGSYDLAFVDPAAAHVTTWSGGATTQSGATPVVVASGAATRSTDVSIAQIQGISGTVTDAVTGISLAGICVYAYTTSGQRTSDPGVCTGETGSYLLPVAAPGKYVVAFVDPLSKHLVTWSGGATTESSAATVTVAAGTTTGGVDAAMAEVQGISGYVGFLPPSVVSGSGSPSGVCLYLYTTTGQRTSVPGVCTTGAGVFLMPVPATGTYLLVATDPSGVNLTTWYDAKALTTGSGTTNEGDATAVTVSAGATATVSMSMVAVQGIAGHFANPYAITPVTGTSAPIPGVCAYLYTTAGQRTADPGACTDAAGDFVLPVAAPGTYLLAFTGPSGTSPAQWFDANLVGTGEAVTANPKLATPVTVSAHRTTLNGNVNLSPGDGISGTILDASTGKPYAGVCVYADYGPPDFGAGQYAGVGSCTGATGTYDLVGLGDGTYRLGYYLPGQAQGTGAPPTTYWYGSTGTVASSEATAATVLVSGGTTTPGVDVTLP